MAAKGHAWQASEAKRVLRIVLSPLPAHSHLQGKRLTFWSHPAPLLAKQCFMSTLMDAMKRSCEMHVHELPEVSSHAYLHHLMRPILAAVEGFSACASHMCMEVDVDGLFHAAVSCPAGEYGLKR